MYIFKNAFVSINRNKGRNILIGLIIIVIATASAVTLAINNAANKIIKSYESKNEITGTISFNRENLMQNFEPGESEDNIEKFNEIESLTVDEIIAYGNSNYVKDYYYTMSTSVDAKDIEKATSSMSITKSTAHGPGGMSGGFTTKEINARGLEGDFTLTGYSSYSSMTEFIEGTYTITKGEVSEDFEGLNCIISSELATLNELEVGDTIKLINPSDDDLTYKLTITGIFKENENENQDSKMQMFSNSANTIITNNSVINKILKDDGDISLTVNPTYILTGKDIISKYESELTIKGLSENYQFSTNLDNIEKELSSISNLKTFAITFLIITLIIGGVVLLVINMINIRERKYEIGVLRTIGMKKSLVTTQFMVELLSIAIVGLLTGAIIGSFVSVPVANKLLHNEINSISENTKNVNSNFGKGQDMPKIGNMGNITMAKVDEINAVVDMKVLAELLGIGILLTLFSSISSTITISRLTPLNILKERG